MLFPSATFLALFCWVLLIHHSPLSWRLKKRHLLLASYLFYASWNPPFVLLLVFSTWVDWWAASRIHSAPKPQARKRWLIISLIANLGLLGLFKYAGFMLEQMQLLLHGVGLSVAFTDPGWILPVGISFFTFQSMSYTLDVYHRRIKPCDDVFDYALFVGFFPQLVAGPIVRARAFLPQLQQQRVVNVQVFSLGLSWFILGLFLKVVMADALFAPVVDQVFAHNGPVASQAAWLSAWLFTGQIFCDFAGYTMCAIGVARCLGFELPVNFRTPLAAIGVVDFWRRWHISLSHWFRDYVYIPLGGNQVSVVKHIRNLMLTMTLVGLWHGAAWTFVVWGVLHGLWLVTEHLFRRSGRRLPEHLLFRPVMVMITYCLISALFVVFRADDLGQAWAMLHAMLVPAGHVDALQLTFDPGLWLVMAALVLLLTGQLGLKNRDLDEVLDRLPVPIRALVLAGAVWLMLLAGGRSDAYIYFQF